MTNYHLRLERPACPSAWTAPLTTGGECILALITWARTPSPPIIKRAPLSCGRAAVPMRARLRSDDEDGEGGGDEGAGSLRVTSAGLRSPAAAWNRTPEPLCCHPPGSLTWYTLCCTHTLMHIQTQMPTVSFSLLWLYIVVVHTVDGYTLSTSFYLPVMSFTRRSHGYGGVLTVHCSDNPLFQNPNSPKHVPLEGKPICPNSLKTKLLFRKLTHSSVQLGFRVRYSEWGQKEENPSWSSTMDGPTVTVELCMIVFGIAGCWTNGLSVQWDCFRLGIKCSWNNGTVEEVVLMFCMFCNGYSKVFSWRHPKEDIPGFSERLKLSHKPKQA